MIRLGLRLTLDGGKEAVVRLVATAVAVALGVGLLLFTLAAINAVNTQNARYSWAATSPASSSQSADASAADPLWWNLQADYFDGDVIARIDIAATGPDSPVPPGIPELPGPGEYYVSPELGDLIDSTAPAELADRFAGEQVGTIGPSALPSPDSLIVVVGNSAAELSQIPGAEQVSAIGTTVPSSCSGPQCVAVGTNSDGIDLILAVTAGALLFPLLIFVGTTSRLAAARREQRFAAMRLVGATPRQVSVNSTVESTVVAALGVAAAFGLFFLLRTTVAGIPFTGEPFFPSDLSLQPAQILVVALGIPVAAAVASQVALRRIQISPLGVSRRVTPKPPRVWRLVPLVAGIAELAIVVIVGRPDTTGAQIAAYLPGFLLTLIGLVVAGPWLTMVGSRRMVGRTGRPAVLLAGRRLSDNPKAGFRAISGLVLALFVSSVAVGVITTIAAEEGVSSGGPPAERTLAERSVEDGTPLPTAPDAVIADLRTIPGVDGVTAVHTNPLGTTVPFRDWHFEAALVSCADLARTPALGSCEPGAEVAAIPPNPFGPWSSSQADTVWSAADLSLGDLADVPVQAIVVATDGSTGAIEQARTALSIAYPELDSPITIGEDRDQGMRGLTAWQQLANVVVLTSLVIAGCSLAVSVAAGMLDRKRPFSLLRLTGVPLSVLRRVVALESAVPLLIVAVVSTAAGFLTAHLFLRVQLDYSLHPPGLEYYAFVAAGLVVSLAVIGSTLPLLDRITGPETARNE